MEFIAELYLEGAPKKIITSDIDSAITQEDMIEHPLSGEGGNRIQAGVADL